MLFVNVEFAKTGGGQLSLGVQSLYSQLYLEFQGIDKITSSYE